MLPVLTTARHQLHHASPWVYTISGDEFNTLCNNIHFQFIKCLTNYRIELSSHRVSFVWNCLWPWLGWSRRTLLFAVHSCFRSTSVTRNKIFITSNKYWMIIYKIIIITKCSSNRRGSSEFWPQFLAFVYINQSIN